MSGNFTQLTLFPEKEGSTSSPPGSRARTYLTLEREEALKRIEADYSLRLSELWMRSTPIAELDQFSFWKTSQVCFLETGELGLEEFTGSWPDEGIIVSGRLYPQPMWERLISGGGGGASAMWPTPRATEIGNPIERLTPEGRMSPDGKTRWGLNLTDSVKLWPTPTAPGKHQVGTIGEWGGSGNPLRTPETMTLKGGSLNPTWVEWLMGYPIGWTDLKD